VRRYRTFLATALVAIGMMSFVLYFPVRAHAMPIHQFDKMAATDQGDYIARLIVGAQKVLIAEGRDDDAAKVNKLFTETLPGDKTTLGLGEFDSNLDRARVVDAQNLVKNPNARRVEVEDAMAVTLKKNGIILPLSFFSVAATFKPKYPPQR
jgi:hypothetical protein